MSLLKRKIEKICFSVAKTGLFSFLFAVSKGGVGGLASGLGENMALSAIRARVACLVRKTFSGLELNCDHYHR